MGNEYSQDAEEVPQQSLKHVSTDPKLYSNMVFNQGIEGRMMDKPKEQTSVKNKSDKPIISNRRNSKPVPTQKETEQPNLSRKIDMVCMNEVQWNTVKSGKDIRISDSHSKNISNITRDCPTHAKHAKIAVGGSNERCSRSPMAKNDLKKSENEQKKNIEDKMSLEQERKNSKLGEHPSSQGLSNIYKKDQNEPQRKKHQNDDISQSFEPIQGSRKSLEDPSFQGSLNKNNFNQVETQRKKNQNIGSDQSYEQKQKTNAGRSTLTGKEVISKNKNSLKEKAVQKQSVASSNEMFPAPQGFEELSGLDLSHLSAEERMMILQVAARAKQIEQVEQQKIRNIEDQVARYSQNARQNIPNPSPPTEKRNIPKNSSSNKTKVTPHQDDAANTSSSNRGRKDASIEKVKQRNKVQSNKDKHRTSTKTTTDARTNDKKNNTLCYLCSTVLSEASLESPKRVRSKNAREEKTREDARVLSKNNHGVNTRDKKDGKTDSDANSKLPVVCASCSHTICSKCSVKSSLYAKGTLCALCAKQRELVARSNLWLKSVKKSQLYRSQSADTPLNPTNSPPSKEGARNKLPWHRRSYSDSGKKNFVGQGHSSKSRNVGGAQEETSSRPPSLSSQAQSRRNSWARSSLKGNSLTASVNVSGSSYASSSSSNSSFQSSNAGSRQSSYRKSPDIGTQEKTISEGNWSPKRENALIFNKSGSPSRPSIAAALVRQLSEDEVVLRQKERLSANNKIPTNMSSRKVSENISASQLNSDANSKKTESKTQSTRPVTKNEDQLKNQSSNSGKIEPKQKFQTPPKKENRHEKQPSQSTQKIDDSKDKKFDSKEQTMKKSYDVKINKLPSIKTESNQENPKFAKTNNQSNSKTSSPQKNAALKEPSTTVDDKKKVNANKNDHLKSQKIDDSPNNLNLSTKTKTAIIASNDKSNAYTMHASRNKNSEITETPLAHTTKSGATVTKVLQHPTTKQGHDLHSYVEIASNTAVNLTKNKTNRDANKNTDISSHAVISTKHNTDNLGKVPCAKPRKTSINKEKDNAQGKETERNSHMDETKKTQEKTTKSSRTPPKVPPRQSSLTNLNPQKTTTGVIQYPENSKIEPAVLKEDELDGSDSFFLAVRRPEIDPYQILQEQKDISVGSQLHASHNSRRTNIPAVFSDEEFIMDENDTEGDFDHLFLTHSNANATRMTTVQDTNINKAVTGDRKNQSQNPITPKPRHINSEKNQSKSSNENHTNTKKTVQTNSSFTEHAKPDNRSPSHHNSSEISQSVRRKDTHSASYTKSDKLHSASTSSRPVESKSSLKSTEKKNIAEEDIITPSSGSIMLHTIDSNKPTERQNATGITITPATSSGSKFPRMPLPSTTSSTAYTINTNSFKNVNSLSSRNHDWDIKDADLDTNIQNFEETMRILSQDVQSPSKFNSEDEDEILRSCTTSVPTFPKSLLGASGYKDPYYYGTDDESEIRSFQAKDVPRAKPKKLANKFMRRTTSTDSFEELLKQSDSAPRATHRGPGKSGGAKPRTAYDKRTGSKHSSTPSSIQDLTRENAEQPMRSSSFSPNENTLQIQQNGDDNWDRRHSLPVPADIQAVRTTFSDPSDLRLPPKSNSASSTDSRPSILVLGPSLESPNSTQVPDATFGSNRHMYTTGPSLTRKKTMVASLSGDFNANAGNGNLSSSVSQCSSMGAGLLADGFARCFSCGTLSTQAISESSSMNVKTNVVSVGRGQSPSKMTPRERIRSVDSSTQVSPTDENFPSDRFTQEGLSLADLRKIKSLIEALNDKSDLDDIGLSMQRTTATNQQNTSFTPGKVVTQGPERSHSRVKIYKDAAVSVTGNDHHLYVTDHVLYPRPWLSHSNVNTPTIVSKRFFDDSVPELQQSSYSQTEHGGPSTLHPGMIEPSLSRNIQSNTPTYVGQGHPYNNIPYGYHNHGMPSYNPYSYPKQHGYNNMHDSVPGMEYGMMPTSPLPERQMYRPQHPFYHQSPQGYHEYGREMTRDSQYHPMQYQSEMDYYQEGHLGYQDSDNIPLAHHRAVTTQPRGRMPLRGNFPRNEYAQSMIGFMERQEHDVPSSKRQSRNVSPSNENVMIADEKKNETTPHPSNKINALKSEGTNLRKCASVPSVFRTAQETATPIPTRKGPVVPGKVVENTSDFYDTEASGAEDADIYRPRSNRRRYRYNRTDSLQSDFEDDDCNSFANDEESYRNTYGTSSRTRHQSVDNRTQRDYGRRNFTSAERSRRSHTVQHSDYDNHHQRRHRSQSHSNRNRDNDYFHRYSNRQIPSSRSTFSRSYSTTSQDLSRGMTHSASRRSLPQPPEDDEYSWRYESVKRQSKMNVSKTAANTQQRADEHVEREVNRLQQTMEDLDQEERELDLRLKYLEIGRSRRPSMTSLSLHDDYRQSNGQSMDTLQDFAFYQNRDNSRQRLDNPDPHTSNTRIQRPYKFDIKSIKPTEPELYSEINNDTLGITPRNESANLLEVQQVTTMDYEIVDDIGQIQSQGFQPPETTSEEDDITEQRTDTQTSNISNMPYAGRRYGGQNQYNNSITNQRHRINVTPQNNPNNPSRHNRSGHENYKKFSFPHNKNYPSYYVHENQYTQPASIRFGDPSLPKSILGRVHYPEDNEENDKNIINIGGYKTMTDMYNYKVQHKGYGVQKNYVQSERQERTKNESDYAELVHITNSSNKPRINAQPVQDNDANIWLPRVEQTMDNNSGQAREDTNDGQQKPEYNEDDGRTVVSDSEAYHLSKERTNWFDKPVENKQRRTSNRENNFSNG